jgi:hypothetical protein
MVRSSATNGRHHDTPRYRHPTGAGMTTWFVSTGSWRLRFPADDTLAMKGDYVMQKWLLVTFILMRLAAKFLMSCRLRPGTGRRGWQERRTATISRGISAIYA